MPALLERQRSARIKRFRGPRTVPVLKMSGAGNDFLMLDNRERNLTDADLGAFALAACPRRISAGADGVIAIEPSRKSGHTYRMRIFNADGSEAEMCGNGARCAAVFAERIGAAGREQKVETGAGTLTASVLPGGRAARIRLSPPGALKRHSGVEVDGARLELFSINTGVPHAVRWVEDLAGVEVRRLGALLRHHSIFRPAGTNVNFAQWLAPDRIRIRTYERGVEDETLACGTGAAACAITAALTKGCRSPVSVEVVGGQILTIHFELQARTASEVYLEGPVHTVYKGEFYWD